MSLTPLRSGLILAALVTLAVVGFRAGGSVAPPSRDPVEALGDANLGLNIIERLRTGERPYSAYGDELRRHHYRDAVHPQLAHAIALRNSSGSVRRGRRSPPLRARTGARGQWSDRVHEILGAEEPDGAAATDRRDTSCLPRPPTESRCRRSGRVSSSASRSTPTSCGSRSPERCSR